MKEFFEQLISRGLTAIVADFADVPRFIRGIQQLNCHSRENGNLCKTASCHRETTQWSWRSITWTLFAMTAIITLFPALSFGASCNINTSAFDFGIYNVFVAAPLDATSQISIRCSGQGTTNTVLVTFNKGTNGNIPNRIMRQLNGNDKIGYNLYIDAARNTIWGDGSGNSATQTVTVLGNNTTTLTVYGRVPALQDVNIGPYNDTVTVTITF